MKEGQEEHLRSFYTGKGQNFRSAFGETKTKEGRNREEEWKAHRGREERVTRERQQ